MSRTYVIAEVGSNHGGSLSAIKRAVSLYAPMADAVKLQWTSDAKRMASRRGAPELADAYERYLQWPADWHGEVASACRHHGTDYLCTVFLPEDVDVIVPHVARYKVASFEARDADLAAAYDAAPRMTTYVSLGMMDEDLAAAAVGLWCSALGEDAHFLHCISAYPAPLEQLQLGALRSGRYSGFSDHSDPSVTITGALAVAAGAEVVEAHVRLPGQSPELPDYGHAMTHRQFAQYVAHIRHADESVGGGGGRREIAPCEEAMAAYRVVA